MWMRQLYCKEEKESFLSSAILMAGEGGASRLFYRPSRVDRGQECTEFLKEIMLKLMLGFSFEKMHIFIHLQAFSTC